MVHGDSQLRCQLEEFARLEKQFRFCGVRFCLKKPEDKHTTQQLIELASQILRQAVRASEDYEQIPVRPPVIR